MQDQKQALAMPVQEQTLNTAGPEAGSRQCRTRNRHKTVQDQKQTLISAGPEAGTRQCRTRSRH
jgi:hypothetical protein